MTDIAQLLGKEAEDLLQHRCTTIPAENLYLPGADFVDRIMIDNNRPNTVLRSMQSLLNHGRLAGTGYLSILPVDQGIEHSAGASFAANPLSNWPLRPVVTASPPLMACWRQSRAATRTKFRSWSN